MKLTRVKYDPSSCKFIHLFYPWHISSDIFKQCFDGACIFSQAKKSEKKSLKQLETTAAFNT